MDYVQVNQGQPQEDRFNISGVRVTDGEDQGAGNRLRLQQLQQADWVAQQNNEKRLLQEQATYT